MKRLIMLTLFLLFTLFGCSNQPNHELEENPPSKDDQSLVAYTTLFPIVDFAKKIGEDHIRIENILPPGTDEHIYEPSTDTLINIAKADLFLYSSIGSEGYVDKIVNALAEEKVTMIDISSGIEPIVYGMAADEHEHEHEHEHHHSDVDPHIWLDPQRALLIAENIYDILAEYKPAEKETFAANLQSLKEELLQLDEQMTQLVQKADKKMILVSHAAFGYWEERYGIEQLSIAGLTTSNEPSQKQLQQLIELAKENNIQYVLFEQNITPKIAEVVKQELQAESLRLHNLAVLTEEDIEQQEDYVSLMKENMNVLQTALNN